MKNLIAKIQTCLTLVAALMLLHGCAPSAIGPMAGFDPDNENGIGGTGMLAQTDSPTAIIGAVTGFGSIFINGAEIEIHPESAVYENGNAVQQPDFAIGDVLEVLAVPGKTMYETNRINIRHEVRGPVGMVNQEKRTFEIMNQVVSMGSLSGPMPESGEQMQVSGFRDQNGYIHASRVTKAQTGTVLLSGQITMRQDNTLLIGKTEVTADQVTDAAIGDTVTVEGELRNGKIIAHTVRTRSALPFAGVAKRWLVQGFVTPLGQGKFTMSGATLATGSDNLQQGLNNQRNTLVQIEIKGTDSATDSPAIVSIMDSRSLPTGSKTPQNSPKTSPRNGVDRPPAKPIQIYRPPSFAPHR